MHWQKVYIDVIHPPIDKKELFCNKFAEKLSKSTCLNFI